MYVEEQVGQHLLKLLPALCQVCCAGVAQLALVISLNTLQSGMWSQM